MGPPGVPCPAPTARRALTVSRIVVGVSACLLGERVRYDGDHRRDPFVATDLARQFELVPVCPEVAIGLGVPRPPIRLVTGAGGVRVRGVADDALDVTERLRGLAAELSPRLARLSGYVFKSGSPSCGIRDVKRFDASGAWSADGVGEYAREVMLRCPWLPVIDEVGLVSPAARAEFVERVYALRRWQDRHPGEVPEITEPMGP